MIKETSQFIKCLRKKRKMTQQEVADKLGMHRTSYILVEQGEKELSFSEAQTISNILGVDLKDLEVGTIPDYEKYKEMILCFLRLFNSKKDGEIPKTKLAKLLYLADFAFFYERMESMSGMQYKRIQYGPVPDSYFRALDELEEEGKINIDKRTTDVILISENKSSKRNALSRIKEQELDLIERITNKWRNKKTREIVDFTHNQLPFKLCAPNEIIPYELIIQEDPQYVY